MELSLSLTVLAVDFDGTLVEDKYPDIGNINREIWDAVKQAQDEGCKIILWTCRTEHWLQDAVRFCEKNGLVFDAVNENLPQIQCFYGGDTRKIFADLYIDDRFAGLSKQGRFFRDSIIKDDPAHNSVNSTAIKHRICFTCGIENHFDLMCPHCGSHAFTYGP